MPAKHTPGPWTLEPAHYTGGKGEQFLTGHYVRSAEREAICRVDGVDETSIADAHLIAAAPEVYEHANWVCRLWGTTHPQGIMDLRAEIHLLRQALLKARGGAPQADSVVA